MHLENFLLNINMYKIDEVMNYEEAMSFKAMYNTDNLTHNVIKKFKVADTNILQSDEDGKYFFEYLPGNTDWDIIYDMQSNVKFKVLVGSFNLKTENLKLVPCCIQYHKISIRMYVEPDQNLDEIYIKFKSVLLSLEERKTLRSGDVIFGDNMYHQGMLCMIYDFSLKV